jgi:hypothetical protein
VRRASFDEDARCDDDDDDDAVVSLCSPPHSLSSPRRSTITRFLIFIVVFLSI